MGGLSVSARVGEVGVNGDIRVYAGLRDDPFFWDLEAQERFQTMGIAAYTDPGTDSLAGINGAISGSWYNPDQNGQGWVIEVLGTSAGRLQFLSYFYGYDNNGEQLCIRPHWLMCSGTLLLTPSIIFYGIEQSPLSTAQKTSRFSSHSDEPEVYF